MVVSPKRGFFLFLISNIEAAFCLQFYNHSRIAINSIHLPAANDFFGFGLALQLASEKEREHGEYDQTFHGFLNIRQRTEKEYIYLAPKLFSLSLVICLVFVLINIC